MKYILCRSYDRYIEADDVNIQYCTAVDSKNGIVRMKGEYRDLDAIAGTNPNHSSSSWGGSHGCWAAWGHNMGGGSLGFTNFGRCFFGRSFPKVGAKDATKNIQQCPTASLLGKL